MGRNWMPTGWKGTTKIKFKLHFLFFIQQSKIWREKKLRTTQRRGTTRVGNQEGPEGTDEGAKATRQKWGSQGGRGTRREPRGWRRRTNQKHDKPRRRRYKQKTPPYKKLFYFIIARRPQLMKPPSRNNRRMGSTTHPHGVWNNKAKSGVFSLSLFKSKFREFLPAIFF